MAKNIDNQILEELSFSKMRPNVSVEQNKENYFVFNILALYDIGDTPAYEDFKDLYISPSRPIRFKRKRDLKKQFKIKGNTLVKSNNVEYTLTDKKGKEKIVVQVEVVDKDPDYAKQSSSTKGNFPLINTSYYIEKQFLHPIDNEKTDPPQSKVVINASTGRKKKSEDWFKQPSRTILETDDTIYVIHETSKKSWKDNAEQKAVFNKTKEQAVDFFITHYKLDLSRKEEILNKAQDSGRYIANRKKAKCKMLITIPKQVLTASDSPTIDLSQAISSLENLTFGEFKQNITTVYEYFKTIAPLVKKENIALDLIKEATNFAATAMAVVKLLQENKLYTPNDEENIKITFGSTYPIIQIAAFPKDVQSVPLPGDPPFEKEYLEELSRPFIIELDKAFLTNKSFSNIRALTYLMNVDLMATQISSSNIQTSKWYDFLVRYTHQMPEYKPASTASQKKFTTSENVENELENLQSNFTDGMTHAAKEAALQAIGPALKSSIGDIQRTMFEKIEDPTIKMIFQNIDQINSLDSLYELVLDKIPIEKILLMANDSITSKIPKNHFLENAADGVNNLPSLDFSSKNITNSVLEKIPHSDELNSKLLGISNKIEKGMSFDFLKNKEKIFDVTEGKTEEIYNTIKNIVSDTITQTIKSLLKTIKNGLYVENDEQKNKKIGSFDIQESITPDNFNAVQLSLNTLKGRFFEKHDIANILKIISELSTPMEILSIFEGRGDSEVIDIVGSEILEQYPQLIQNLSTIYDKEDFLILVGRNILFELTTRIGEEQIKEVQDAKMEIDFCDSEEVEDLIDHLVGRFPDDFLEEQKQARLDAKSEIKALVDGLDRALTDGTLEDFLFGNKIKDLLNSIVEDSRSTNAMVDMIVKGYFGPVESIYSIESLRPGDAFLSQETIQEKATHMPLPQGVQIKINVLRSKGQDDEANELENKASEGKKKIALVLKSELTDLKTSLKEQLCRADIEDNSYTIGKGATNIKIKFSDFETQGLFPPTGSSNIMYKDIDLQNTPTYSLMYITGNINGQEVFSSARDVKLSDTEMHNKNYLDVDDYNIPPRKAAFVSYVKEIFENKIDFGFFGDLSVSQDDLNASLDDIKKYVFDYSSMTLVNRLADKASKSAFFEIANLKKLKFATTEGDKRVPPLACDEENTEEAAKSQTNQDQLIEEIILLEDIERRFKERRSFFASLEKERNEKIFNRTDLENAILMEATESFFKVLALEFLISGIFVYSEISVKSLLNDKNNFDLMQSMMLSTMDQLGQEFKNNFSEYLKQYIEIKKEISNENSLEGEVDSSSYLNELADISPGDLPAIVNYIFKEQVFNIYEAYQKAVRLVSNKQKLEVDEFLDVIPNVDIAWSSMPTPEQNRYMQAGSELKEIVKNGGFILEKYIRSDYGTPPQKQVTLLTDFVINRKNIIKVPTLDINGNLTWVQGGDEASLDLNVLNSFLKVQAPIIHEKAKSNIYGQEYQSYVDHPGSGFVKQLPQVKSVDEIFDILFSKYNSQGDEFLQTLEGYDDFKKALENVNYNIDDPNAVFAYPNYTGMVNIKAFKEMQDFIKNDVNKELEETLQTAVDTYEDLVKSSNVLSTYEEEIEEFQAIWGEKYNIIKNILSDYTDKFTNPIQFDLPNPGGFPNPHPFSDEKIFEWKGIEEDLKKKWSGNNSALYLMFGIEIKELAKEITDIIVSRMQARQVILVSLLENNESDTLWKVGHDPLSEEEVGKTKDMIEALQERITYLIQPVIIETLNALELESAKITEKEKDIDFLTEGYVYDTNIKDFFVSQIKAAQESQQEAWSDYDNAAVTGPYTQYFKSLKYGIRLSYVYPGIDTGNFFNTQLDNIKTRMDKICGEPTENNNYFQKTYKIKEVFSSGLDNIKIRSIPLLQQEEEINNYFQTQPPKSSEAGDEPNNYLPLTYPTIVEDFPLQVLKDKMIESDEYKMLLSEIYKYGDFVTMLGLYTSFSTVQSLYQDVSLGIFSGTKVALKNVFESVLESKDFTYVNEDASQTDLMKNNMVDILNPADNPSLESGVKQESFGYAAAFAAQTGMLILKYFVEKTDPAIIRAKQWQKLITTATELGESAADVINGGDTNVDPEDTPTDQEKAAAEEAQLLPLVIFPVRAFPLMPFFSDPTVPLTPAGLVYLALTSAGGGASGKTSQDVIEQENPDKNCDDK